MTVSRSNEEIQRRLLYEQLRDAGKLPITSNGGTGRSETFCNVTYGEWDGRTRSQQQEEWDFWAKYDRR